MKGRDREGGRGIAISVVKVLYPIPQTFRFVHVMAFILLVYDNGTFLIGTMAAAHTISIQMFQLGSVASLALSTIAAIVVPTIMAKAKAQQHPDGLLPARRAANRLLSWSVIVGAVLAVAQLLSLPLLGLFSPLPDVQQAARGPAAIGAFLQMLNCVIWTGEGVMQGTENFATLAAGTILGTAAMIGSLKFLGFNSSLMGVWMAFGFLGIVRLATVLRFHFFTGPLASKNLRVGFA